MPFFFHRHRDFEHFLLQHGGRADVSLFHSFADQILLGLAAR